MMAEPKAVRRGYRAEGQIACCCRCLERRRKERMNLLEDPLERLACVIPVLEQAVEDEAKPRIKLAPVGSASEQEVPYHEVGHLDERSRRGLESGETFESWIALTAQS